MIRGIRALFGIVCFVTYLDGLNEKQKEAVLAKDGPISVLAGAGSGKTRVLTTRIYHLIREGILPENILAVTFTNKAAREMKERLSERLPGSMPFVATFHGLGRELLQTYGRPMDIPRYFSVYDRDDSERVIKEALKALDVDPKEVPPRSILGRISKAKGDGMTASDFQGKHGRESFRNRITSEVWLRYESALKKEKALDFDDLISLPVRLLEEHKDIRDQVQERFHYLHIDEFQDTNDLQGRLTSLIAGERKNVFVVGDIDQCLVKGTRVRLENGKSKPIEKIQEGDVVLSSYGSADMRPARVTRAIERTVRSELVRITTSSGKVLESTPEHMHFAGYRLGASSQHYFTYLMYKKGTGWRLGVSSTYTRGQRKPMLGFKLRTNHEHADAVWIVGVHKSPQEARVHEYMLSLSYSIPTLPFVARKGGSISGYVHNQQVLDTIFSSFDTESAALNLLKDQDLSLHHPHHRAQATRSDRRNINVTLCGDRRSSRAMHRISMVGSDTQGRDLLSKAGFSVRSAKLGSSSWRYESAYADFGDVEKIVERLRSTFPDASVVQSARLGKQSGSVPGYNALPIIPASSVLPGMAMFNEDGEIEVVAHVERRPEKEYAVYDIDVEGTHNFSANGLLTHNCIYTWRGATIDNLLSFEKTYPAARTIVLENNYRSTKTIVEAANQIIEKNRNRKEKRSVTENGEGERILLHAAENADLEAVWIAREAKRLIRNGTSPESIAVLMRTNFQSRALEEAMLRESVPYKLLGTRFFDRKEVKDVIAWMRLTLDPTREADRMRATQFPSRGIGKVLLGKLLAGKREELKAGEKKKVEAFEDLIQELHSFMQGATPSVVVRAVIKRSGIEETLAKGGDDDQERLENVKELATLAARYDHLAGEEGIAAFLADAALAGDQDELDRTEKRGVTLMTVHASKGLEFDAVFVTGLEEGLFPHEGMNDEDRDEEEERRLFYVAITRARKRLILTYARVRRIYGTDYLQEPSQFLHDIEPGYMEFSNAYGEEEGYIIQI